ncbi:hypothetical protein [Bacillus sp. B-jedd]|nr:hypothetical protein [Bacillus sp. B-jedd]
MEIYNPCKKEKIFSNNNKVFVLRGEGCGFAGEKQLYERKKRTLL